MTLSLEDLLVVLAATVDVLAKTGDDEDRITLVIDKRKLDREVLIENADSLLTGLREALQRLKEIDEKEEYFKARRPGASSADCIGFLFQEIKELQKTALGLHRDISVKLFEATIAHLQELHGRREAADKDAYKRREEEAAKAREKRKEYEKQNSRREEKTKQRYYNPFEEAAGRYQNNAWDGTITEEAIRRAKKVFDEMFNNHESKAYYYGFDSAFEQAKKRQSKRDSDLKSVKWYEILGVSAGANREEINKAWRLLAKKHHPDREGGSNEMMSKINAARDEGLGGLH